MSGNEIVLPSDPRSDRRHDLSGKHGVKSATGQAGAGNQAPPGNNDTGRPKIKLRNKFRVGTWNVRGLLAAGKLRILEAELERCNSTITGLSETHWKNSGHFDTEKHTIYFSGNENSSFAGVAIAIPKVWNGSVLGYDPISERIMAIKLSASPTPINIVQVYAPTSAASDGTVEDFYAQLETCIAKVPNRELLIVLGDFNAKVGSTKADINLRNIVGEYGLGVRNERGERLIQFAADNNLTIMNTVFKHHFRRLYTWTSPDGNYRNQIDYIMIRSRWRSSISNAHTLPGADCLSDHQLLVSTLKMKLQNTVAKRTKQRLQILDKEAFAKTLQDGQHMWMTDKENKTPDSLWQSAKDYIKNSVQKSQPKPVCDKRQHWMSEDTWRLVNRRRDAKANGASIQELNDLGSEIQAACRRDRNSELKNICTELERHSQKFETKDLHMKIKVITRQFKAKTWAVENSAGESVTDIKLIVKVWEDYCKSLFTDSPNATDATISYPSQREPCILREEVAAAIKHLKRGKAVGVDEIPIEVIRDMGDIGVDIMHIICTKIWDTGEWPRDWSKSVFIPLHKKGSTKKCNNYRLISLISHGSKILLHILNTRLQAFLNREIAQEQAGFVKGRGTREQILILRQIIEKSREFNKPLFLCFVDFRKAFDTVKWSKLWNILLEMGVPQHLVYLIRRLYEDGTAAVQVDGVDSANFKTQAGVRQGCILSPLLFNIYTEYIMRKVLDQWDKGISLGGRMISNLRYADDTTLLAPSLPDIENLLQLLECTSLEYGLAINREKTKMMIVDRKTNNRPEIHNIGNCAVVQSYIYLGSTINNTGSCEEEIRRRCAVTRSAVEKLKKIWRDRRITKNTKVRLMRCLVFPIFLYGAETWTIRQKDRSRIDALEMWCWRRLLRISWTEHRTNVSILKELHIKQRLSSIVQLRTLKMFGHIIRNEDSMERLVVQGRIEGQRSRGRSPTRWTDLIK